MRARFNAEKVDMVKKFMAFRAQESEVFWPIYNEYERERREIADTRIELLQLYADYNQSLTNDQAKYWSKKVFKMQQKEVVLNKKYYKKLSKALSPLFGLRFYQFEMALQVEIRNEIMKKIPLLEYY